MGFYKIAWQENAPYKSQKNPKLTKYKICCSIEKWLCNERGRPRYGLPARGDTHVVCLFIEWRQDTNTSAQLPGLQQIERQYKYVSVYLIALPASFLSRALENPVVSR